MLTGCRKGLEDSKRFKFGGGKISAGSGRLLDQVIAKNCQDEKAISLVMELAIGKVQEIIQRMIQIYEPAVLIVGTRGRSLGGMQGLLPGSVSKYCLQQSPIPVIVVRPTSKRQKNKQKRLADPSRRGYNHILRLSETKPGYLFGRRGSVDSTIAQLQLEEAATGAEAARLMPSRPGEDPEIDSILSFSQCTISATGPENGDGENTEDTGGASVANPDNPDPDSPVTVLKGPGLTDLDSPTLSEDGGGRGHAEDITIPAHETVTVPLI